MNKIALFSPIHVFGASVLAADVEGLLQPRLARTNNPALQAARRPRTCLVALPFCADESCHVAEDIDRVAATFQAVNIKLDKAGGLTEALRLSEAAKARGLKTMVGCMLSTSLGIRPAFHLAQTADWVDLDGPALLKKDRAGGFRFENGIISLG